MALFLVQHGRSLSKDQDPEQGLSAEGIAESERIAQVAGGYGVRVGQIHHSGKKRARQTAAIFAAVLTPQVSTREVPGLKPLDEVTAMAAGLDDRQDLMLVGHLPFMEKLTAYLITGSIDIPVFKFQNSGIVCLARLPDCDAWTIQWTLMPNIGS